MRKKISAILVLALLASLCACTAAQPGNSAVGSQGTPTAPNLTATQPAEPDIAPTAEPTGEPDVQPTTEPVEELGGYYAFAVDGVELIPGQAFDSAALPEANSVYQVPSCAFEGTDNVYIYGGFELTAYNEGDGEFIYSIYLTDPNLTTPEGLALGDDAERVTELYGQNYTENGTQWEFYRGDTVLNIIIQNDFVASIEYCMAQ